MFENKFSRVILGSEDWKNVMNRYKKGKKPRGIKELSWIVNECGKFKWPIQNLPMEV
jgi:hypothetical protein